jgi:HEAT repeat protein
VKKEMRMTVTQLRRLLAQLKQPEPKQRVRAIEKIGGFARYVEQAVQPLIDGLTDSDCRVRQQSALQLGWLRPPVPESVPPLINALKDPDADVREAAVKALYFIRPDSSDAVTALIEAMDDSAIVDEAIQALGAIGPPARIAVPMLMEAMQNDDLAYTAVEALGRIGPDAKPALPLIAAMLKSPKILRRRCAAVALGGIGPAAGDAMPLLMDALRDEALFEQVRQDCDRHRGQPLFNMLPNHPGHCQIDIAVALWRIWQHPVAIHVLVERLRDEVPRVRLRALDALKDIGHPAAAATAHVANVTGDPDMLVRCHALEALAAIGPAIDGVVPVLIAALDDPSWTVRSRTAGALGRMGPIAAPAVNALVELLPHPAAAAALWQIARHELAITSLVGMLEEPGSDSQWAAMELAEIGPAAKCALPAFLRLRHSADVRVRCTALNAIESIAGSPQVN